MTPQERANLAESLMANPLFAELFNGVEHDATEALIYATDDATRARAAMRVQAVRALRDDCMSMMQAIRERKGAPA